MGRSLLFEPHDRTRDGGTPLVNPLRFDVSRDVHQSIGDPRVQDYWLLYLFPLVYYYGDMKLGKD